LPPSPSHSHFTRGDPRTIIFIRTAKEREEGEEEEVKVALYLYLSLSLSLSLSFSLYLSLSPSLSLYIYLSPCLFFFAMPLYRGMSSRRQSREKEKDRGTRAFST
jgi:hypothetical protein